METRFWYFNLHFDNLQYKLEYHKSSLRIHDNNYTEMEHQNMIQTYILDEFDKSHSFLLRIPDDMYRLQVMCKFHERIPHIRLDVYILRILLLWLGFFLTKNLVKQSFVLSGKKEAR